MDKYIPLSAIPPKQDWLPLDSSALQEMAYHQKREELWIRFQSGIVYRYKHCHWVTAKQFREADSHGTYFNTEIRGIYPCERMDIDQLPAEDWGMSRDDWEAREAQRRRIRA